MFGEDLPDEMTKGRSTQHGQLGPRLGTIRPPALSVRSGRWSAQAPVAQLRALVDRISAGIGTNRTALPQIGGARDFGPAFGRDRGAPTGRNRTSTGISRMGGEPDMPRYCMLHAAFHNGKT